MMLSGSLTDPVSELADALGESDTKIIRRLRWLYKQIGADATRALFVATNIIERNGGLVTRRGTRRKTAGGVFFELVRQYFIAVQQRKLARSLTSRRKRKEKRVHGFAPVGPARVRFRKKGMLTRPTEPLPFDRATKIALDIFPKEARLIKVGANQADHVLILHFAFPDVATRSFADNIEQLKVNTNWRVIIYPRPNQEALMNLAYELITVPIRGKPGVRPQDRSVLVRCEQAPEGQAQLESLFVQQTGWNLRVRTLQ